MRPLLSFVFLALGLSSFISDEHWLTEKHKGYSLFFTRLDQRDVSAQASLFDNGIAETEKFFRSPYKSTFSIYVHPNRRSLDSTWQKDWNIPNFKSECWMVASGIGSKLDMIAPRSWVTDACEHKESEVLKTQQLITHELVHVYHGQHNVSPDFSNVESIDWFIEGLATYASGQCDSARMTAVKEALAKGTAPAHLDDFWTGKLKYGLSGSVVKFIDQRYGREKLTSLLKFNRKSEILSSLETSEADLLLQWKKYIGS